MADALSVSIISAIIAVVAGVINKLLQGRAHKTNEVAIKTGETKHNANAEKIEQLELEIAKLKTKDAEKTAQEILRLEKSVKTVYPDPKTKPTLGEIIGLAQIVEEKTGCPKSPNTPYSMITYKPNGKYTDRIRDWQVTYTLDDGIITEYSTKPIPKVVVNE